MIKSYRIQQNAGDIRIEYQGHLYAEDELNEVIWLVTIELGYGLPWRERIKAKRQIAQFKMLLDALREVSAGT